MTQDLIGLRSTSSSPVKGAYLVIGRPIEESIPLDSLTWFFDLSSGKIILKSFDPVREMIFVDSQKTTTLVVIPFKNYSYGSILQDGHRRVGNTMWIEDPGQ